MNLLPWQTANWQELLQRKQKNCLPHAMLLVGEDGLGKKRFALQFAQLLLCNRADMPCGQCHACHLFRAQSHPDFLFIEPEQPGQMIKIDQIREAVEFVGETALQGGFRVILIAPANAMNLFAANALLKTLEEPAPNTIIILISDPNVRLPATIKSRCQTMVFAKPSREVALAWLKAELLENKIDLNLLLDLNDGAPLQVKKFIENDFLTLRTELYQGLHDLVQHKADPLKLASILQEKEMSRLLKFLLSFLQDLLKLKLIPTETVINQDYYTVLAQLVSCFSQEKILYIIEHIQKIYQYITRSLNLNKQLLLEEIFILWVKYATD